MDFSGACAPDGTDSFKGLPEAGSNRTLLSSLSSGLSRWGEVRSRFLSIERRIFRDDTVGSAETLALSEVSIDFWKSASRVCMRLSVDELSSGVIWKRLLGWKKKNDWQERYR